MANVKDGATSLVATAPSPATSGTSLVVTSGEGALFPSPPFYAILHPASSLPKASIAEKVLVTAVSTDTFTIVRAQGIYTAKSVAVGWRISNAIFQEDLNNSSIIQNEVPGGTINGSNTAFTLASATGMVTGSLKLFKNGIRLKGSGNDYTETSTGFTMTTAPATGTLLLADYNVNGALNNVGTNSIIVGEVPTGTVNGSNAVFTTARAYVAGSVDIKVNGISQARTTHFTETTPASGTITLGDAPLTGDIVTVDYMYNLNPSGNSDTVDGIHASSTPTANQLLALDSNAVVPTAALGGAWTAWTPTVTAGSGTFTSATGAGRYIQIGKIVFYKVDCTITTVGSGQGCVFTLPVTAQASQGHLGSAREDATSGFAGIVKFASTTSASVSKYDNGNITSGGSGSVVRASGFYEAA